MEVTVSRSKEKTDRSESIICFVRDITERIHAEKAKADARVKTERIKQLEAEVHLLEKINHYEQTAITAQMYGVTPVWPYLPAKRWNLWPVFDTTELGISTPTVAERKELLGY